MARNHSTDLDSAAPRTGLLHATRFSQSLSDHLVEVALRLYDEFNDRFTLGEILETVDSCRRDLDLATEGGLPELVERLARQRLSDRTPADT